jgi:hypothetical protein
MENSDADPQLVAVAVALKLTRDLMASTGLLAYHSHRDRHGFGFGYEVAADNTTTVDVSWRGRAVLHVTVNTDEGCEQGSMQIDDRDMATWVDAMRGAIEGVRVARQQPASTAMH